VENMIELLVGLLVLVIIIYIANLVIGMLNLPAQIKQIVYIIMAVIVLFYLLDFFGLYHFAR
jgi:hypothetical protein